MRGLGEPGNSLPCPKIKQSHLTSVSNWQKASGYVFSPWGNLCFSTYREVFASNSRAAGEERGTDNLQPHISRDGTSTVTAQWQADLLLGLTLVEIAVSSSCFRWPPASVQQPHRGSDQIMQIEDLKTCLKSLLISLLLTQKWKQTLVLFLGTKTSQIPSQKTTGLVSLLTCLTF